MTLRSLSSGLMRFALRLAAVGLLALSTVPASAEYIPEYMGGGAIYQPYNCSWPTGVEMTRARYIPSETRDGPSQVTLMFAVAGVNLYTIRAPLSESRTWRRASGRSIWGELYWMGSAPYVRVLNRDDAVVDVDADIETTNDIRLRLRIRNFNGQRGCSVSVALMLHRWN